MSLVSVKSLQSLPPGSDTRPAQVRVRLKIPKHYRNDPILSTLVNQHQITINILSALLAVDTSEGGWFDLEMQGTQGQLAAAILHINDLGVELWGDVPSDELGW